MILSLKKFTLINSNDLFVIFHFSSKTANHKDLPFYKQYLTQVSMEDYYDLFKEALKGEKQTEKHIFLYDLAGHLVVADHPYVPITNEVKMYTVSNLIQPKEAQVKDGKIC